MSEHAQTSTSRWSDFRAGVLDSLPLWMGGVPFGIIFAVSAVAAGLSPAQTLAMSLLVFAGASQFTAVGLFAAGAAGPAIVLTTLIVNARHLLMAASLAPFLRRERLALKALLAFQLTDESYALGIKQYLSGQGRATYMLAVNLSLYLMWQCSTLAGIALGALIDDPAAYGLDLIFPLTFIALLVPLLRDRASVLVAAAAAVLAVGGALALPGRWYILLAGIAASGLGALLPSNESNVASGK